MASTGATWTSHRNLAYALANEYRIPGIDAEDVRQEALIALWEAARSHDKTKGPFKPWARRIINGRLTDLLRKATRAKRSGITVEFIDANVPAGGELYAIEDLREAMRSLTRRERQAVSALLNGTFDWNDKSRDNALTSARRKLKAAV